MYSILIRLRMVKLIFFVFQAYELRQKARSENRRYCDPSVLTYQAERMPEQIRLKVGGVTQQQITVYEEFARCIPGFAPSQKRDLPPHQQQSQVAAAQAFFRAGVQVE